MRKKLSLRIFVVALSLMLVGVFAASAAELNVPGEYGTIQAAVNAAESGDTVLVAEGTYDGDVTIEKPNITIKAEGEAGNTIIKGTINIVETNGTVVDGMSITGPGDGIRGRGNLRGDSPSLIVRNSFFDGNHGTGIDLSHGATYAGVTIETTEINRNGGDGVNLSGVGEGVVLNNNTISYNGTLEATGVGVRITSSVMDVVVENNTMAGNAFANIHPG